MGDKRRMYNLQSTRGDGLLVQSVSDDYDDDDLLISGAKSRKSHRLNYLKTAVLVLSVLAVFMSGFFSHILIAGFGKPAVLHKVGNIGSVVDKGKIREYHQELTRSSHLAGEARNYELAQYVADRLTEFTFDEVELRNYSVRLGYPDPANPNSVRLLNTSGGVLHECRTREVPLTDFERDNPTTPLFNGHSKAGSVKAPYVYVNLARKEDFVKLKNNNISVKGKIVLARYGTMYRGNKVQNAAEAGAVAIVLFKDLNYLSQSSRYPDSEYAPSSAGERGNTLLDDGDTDTYGWPSGLERFVDATGPLTTAPIISQPITGDDAIVLLRALPPNKDMPLPKKWTTHLLPDGHEVGTGSEEGPSLQVVVNVEVRRVNITNVIGTIVGAEEPDRWVILGNHRDAWTYGAIDPGSGTAAMLGSARALSHFLAKGWRPRRTIKVASWDAEEWGLIGSLEWVEEHRAVLRDRGVAYINTDIASGGLCHGVWATGSPLYQNLTMQVLDQVNGRRLYDGIDLSGSSSDMFGFYSYAGISVLDVECVSSSDVYHTLYDNQHLFEIADPEYNGVYNVSSALSQLVIKLSESKLIPGHLEDYVVRIRTWWDALKPDLLSSFTQHQIDHTLLQIIEGVLSELGEVAGQFQAELGKLSSESTLADYRILNDKILGFDRAFLVDKEIPGASFYSRNILVSPSSVDIYAGSGFPGLVYATSSPNATRDELLFELERVRWAIVAATQILQ